VIKILWKHIIIRLEIRQYFALMDAVLTPPVLRNKYIGVLVGPGLQDKVSTYPKGKALK
jgi:hypothetical protein